MEEMTGSFPGTLRHAKAIYIPNIIHVVAKIIRAKNTLPYMFDPTPAMVEVARVQGAGPG